MRRLFEILRIGDRFEDGFTLVEIMMVVALMAVVIAITTPVVAMFFDMNSNVQQTYAAENQEILSSETLTQYLHEAVAPCPSGSTQTGCYTTPYATTTQTALTFFANVNNANGPAEVTVLVSGTTLTATEYLPTSSSGCPFNGSTSAACSYTSSKGHTIVTVSNLSTTTPFSYLQSSGATCLGTTASPCSGIVAVYLSIQTSSSGKGQTTGYSTLAYALAPDYNGSVG
jgi:prepilin-type N-terminal cleavage/methylation domain-containing protein